MELNHKAKKKKHSKSDKSKLNPPQMVKVSGSNRMHAFLMCAKNLVIGNSGSRNLKQSLALMTPEGRVTVRKVFRQMSQEVLGTWEPTHWFRQLLPTNVAGVTGILAVVNTITNQGGALYDEFEAIFDEVQPVGPFEVTYYSLVTSTSHEWGTGVIDYDNSTALASVEGALSYDTAKIFCLNPYLVGRESEVTWQGHLQGYPDKDWTDVSTTQNYAYWKVYNYTGVTGSTTYGVTGFKLLLRFRQVSSGS